MISTLVVCEVKPLDHRGDRFMMPHISEFAHVSHRLLEMDPIRLAYPGRVWAMTSHISEFTYVSLCTGDGPDTYTVHVPRSRLGDVPGKLPGTHHVELE